MKNILIVLLILALGVFFYLKVKVTGDRDSGFNQTTRYTLGTNGFWRSVFGLHQAGDARREYFLNQGPVLIEWFKPISEEIDEKIIEQFAERVSQILGRPTQITFGGGMDDGMVAFDNLDSFELKAKAQQTDADSVMVVFFAKDYSPRKPDELSSTYRESGIVISLDAHRTFTQGFDEELSKYVYSSLLHEFGHQIGLVHNDDTDCIMSVHAGVDGKPLKYFGRYAVQDFCQTEKDQINKIKLDLVSN